MADALETMETMALGVVMERRRSQSPWQDWSWRPVAVIPGAPPVEGDSFGGDWRLLRESEDWAHFHAATVPLELYRSDTEGYRLNLSQEPPRLWVALRTDGEGTPVPFFVTASAHECEVYQISGNEVVEAVPMPPEVMALLRDFVEQHHVDVPFEKRERKRHKSEGPKRP